MHKKITRLIFGGWCGKPDRPGGLAALLAAFASAFSSEHAGT
jgi:hypothetical protein